MDVRHIGRRLLEPDFDLGLLRFQLHHPGLHDGLIHPVLNRFDDAPDGSLDLAEHLPVNGRLRPLLLVFAIHDLVEGTRCPLHGFR